MRCISAATGSHHSYLHNGRLGCSPDAETTTIDRVISSILRISAQTNM
jgi:hypothetical protein